MDDQRRERLGSALQGLARELVAERQRTALLERENKRLRAELEALRGRPSPVKSVAAVGGPKLEPAEDAEPA